MSDRLALPERPRSSPRRYRAFVEDYKRGRLDDSADGGGDHRRLDDSADTGDHLAPEVVRSKRRGKRREYLRDYFRWLQPHRYAVGVLLVIALLGAGLEMIKPLFMRFMVDGLLLNTKLDSASRLSRLHLTGWVFLGVIVLSNLIRAFRDYRQRLLNTHVMLALRRSLFERLLHLPRPKLWNMKTDGLLSRLTGDVDTNRLVADGQPERGVAGHSREPAEPELDFPGRRSEVPTGGAEQAPSPLPGGSWSLVGRSGVKGRDRFASDFCAACLLGAQR